MAPRCNGCTVAGKPCRAPAVGDSGKCFAHAEPARWAAAADRGRRTHRPRLPVVVTSCPSLETAAGLRVFLAGVLYGTVAGDVPVNVAHAAAQLGNSLRGLIEASDIEQRISALERNRRAT